MENFSDFRASARCYAMTRSLAMPDAANIRSANELERFESFFDVEVCREERAGHLRETSLAFTPLSKLSTTRAGDRFGEPG